MVVFHDKLILGSLVPRTPFLFGESCIFDRVQDSFFISKTFQNAFILGFN